MALVSTAPALNRNTIYDDLGLVNASSIFAMYYDEVNHMTQMSLGITVWIVKDIDVFESRVFSDNFAPSSNLDRSLNIDILYEEWSAFLGALKADPERYRKWTQEWDKGKNEEYFKVPDYPMLSRLNNHFVDVSYTTVEIDALKQEAKGLIADTNMVNEFNEPALSLLHKILTICDEAQKQNLSVYLMSP